MSAHSDNVVWQPSRVSRELRRRALGMRGATVWLTGLPAAGKTTLARAVEEKLVAAGVAAYHLDGDNLRHGLNGDLGFTPEDREENVRRTGEVAALLADAGFVGLVSLVSPYAAGRRQARAVHERAELPFLEVFLDTPLEVCERRDPKGLYARARAGEISHMTGLDDPYEQPDAPELTVRPDGVEAAVEAVIGLLRDRGIGP